MFEEEKDKKSLFIHDFNTNEKTFTNKIFRYFYSLFQEKKEFKLFWKYIQILIETFQLISYSFSSNHYNSWKLDEKKIKTISNIVGIFRVSVLIQYLNYKIYTVIFYVLLILIFIFCLIVIIQLIFIDSNSIKYRLSTTIIRSFIDIISIICYIPFTEIILIPIKCIDGKVYGLKNAETCWKKMHYLILVLGIIGAILLFIWCLFMMNFSFYPFQKLKSSIRINSNNDIINLFLKLFLILQYLLISNEYISLVILFLASITMTISNYLEPSYNSNHLELIVTIKNLMILWTYFVLFVSKIFKNFITNGFIYLLVLGYPIIIYFSYILHKERIFETKYFFGNIKNINEYIQSIKFYIKIVDSFINRNQFILRNNNENEGQRNIILLKGYIEFHSIACTNKECPLGKFLKNEGNFNTQRQCLLNYINILFNKGFKFFPDNVSLLILYIQFNLSKKFNLNKVKANFLHLKKLKCTIKQKYIIYCMEQNLKNLNNNNGNNRLDNKNINNFESLNLKKTLKSQTINHRSISTDKAKIHQNNNINSITNDTSDFTHSTKKTFSVGAGLKNYTEDISKFRMGLLSAGSSPNNDIIIPIIPMRRPVSNFNFGGGQLWNNLENNINTQNPNKKIIFDNKETIDYDKEKEDKQINKIFKSQDLKRKFNSSPIKNEVGNLYIGMDKIITKLHKIKIEKGMMNTGIFNSLSKKLTNDYQTQLKQYKNNYLPIMFNNYNKNHDKNSKTINFSNEIGQFRSHSFNNKNNIS